MRSKKFVIAISVFLALILVALVSYFRGPQGEAVQAYNAENLIRFHVLANSDSAADQALKRKVRDRIVQVMSPKLSKAADIKEARKIAQENLGDMEKLAAQVIKEEGGEYPVSAGLGKFPFPSKSYGQLTLPAGEYEAVRVVIGQGAGANWWCVLFPPLCFVSISESVATATPEAIPASTAQNQKPKIEIRFKLVDTYKKIMK